VLQQIGGEIGETGPLLRRAARLPALVENIDHSCTKVKSPQTNGIVQRFHRTALNEFYRVAFRRKICASIEELQRDLDLWLKEPLCERHR
jgi:hypothetical protein